MKKKCIIFFYLLLICSTPLLGKELNGVRVIELKEFKEKVMVRMQLKDGSKESYFYVQLNKKDPTFNKKYQLLKQKVEKKADNEIDMDIKSFSAYPYGGTYQGEQINIK